MNHNSKDLDLIKQLLFGAILRTYEVHNLDKDPPVIEQGDSLEAGFEKQWAFIEPKLNRLILEAQIRELKGLWPTIALDEDASPYDKRIKARIKELEAELESKS